MSDPSKNSEPEASPGAVEARTPKGFKDSMAGEMLLKNRMIATVRQVFERYGFSPLETPAVERLDVLVGKYGDEGNKSIFRFETVDEEAVGLRFDLTVPLARVIAQYPDLPRPFRRYQVSPVWRVDKPGPGRYREFTQFDIDTVGSSQVTADVEIVAAMLDVFAALGIADAVVVRVSSRRLLDAMVRWAGIPESRATEVFRVLDKLDKIGLDAVKLELMGGRVDASGSRIAGLGLDAGWVASVELFLDVPRRAHDRRAGTLAAVSELLGSTAADAVAELAAMDAQLAALGHGESRVVFDVTLARGLAYYTGPIFEAVLPEAPDFGSVFGGGRYDGLVERFLGERIAGTGGSIGVDRLIAAMLSRGVWRERASAVDVLVTVLDPTLMGEYQRLARELRAAGFNTEIFLGDKRGLKKQLAHADKIGARVALLLGGDELAQGEVTVKDLLEGAQKGTEIRDREQYLGQRFAQRAVPRADLVATVGSILSATP